MKKEKNSKVFSRGKYQYRKGKRGWDIKTKKQTNWLENFDSTKKRVEKWIDKWEYERELSKRGGGYETLQVKKKMRKNIGSKSKPVKIEAGLEGYKKEGFWIYRNSNPKASLFARMWMRQTDPKMNEKWDKKFKELLKE